MPLGHEQKESSRPGDFVSTAGICSWQPSFLGASQPIPQHWHLYPFGHRYHVTSKRAFTLLRKVLGTLAEAVQAAHGKGVKAMSKQYELLGQVSHSLCLS